MHNANTSSPHDIFYYRYKKRTFSCNKYNNQNRILILLVQVIIFYRNDLQRKNIASTVLQEYEVNLCGTIRKFILCLFVPSHHILFKTHYEQHVFGCSWIKESVFVNSWHSSPCSLSQLTKSGINFLQNHLLKQVIATWSVVYFYLRHAFISRPRFNSETALLRIWSMIRSQIWLVLSLAVP